MSQAISEFRPLSRPSSLFSYAASDSQRTTTDTSTVWGPGTLSGRALLALGEVTIRGINKLVIRRRLAAIRLRAPSLSKIMCDDLLELCRPAMYSQRIGKEAVRLILTQICAESKYSMFVLAICDWPQDEARLIIRQLISSLSELLHPSGWQLEGIYNFLVAIIQVKEQWRDLVVETAILLRSMFQDQHLLIGHPIHILSTPESNVLPLSTLQKTYSSTMRSEVWLSLHACGLPWQDRMRKIEEIMATELELDLSDSNLLEAINDVVIFTGSNFNLELQSAAISCLRQINGARWKPVCELFGFPSTGFRKASPAQALGPHRQCSAEEIADAHDILRKVFLNAWDSSFHKLVKLCLSPNLYPSQITDTAIFLTLRNICHDSVSSWIQMALGVCALSMSQLQQIIKTLVQDAHLVLCSLGVSEKKSAVKSFCDFLAAVFQIKGDYNWLSAHTALQIIKITWKVEHPVVLVCRNIIKARPILPFSRIQTLYSVDGRQMIWIALQASGEGLETRLQDIIGVLNAEILDSAEMSTPKFLDALADAVIFTSEAFSHELRHSAIKCLLDHCVNSRRWEILHQVFSFDSHVQRLIFTTLRDKLSQEELCDFVRAYPTDSAHISDLFLLLSGWAIGLQSYSQDGSRV